MSRIRNIDRIQQHWLRQGRYRVGSLMSPEAKRVLRDALKEQSPPASEHTPENHPALAGMKRGTPRFEVMVWLAHHGRTSTQEMAVQFEMTTRQVNRMMYELQSSNRVVMPGQVPLKGNRGGVCNTWEVNDDYERA